MKKPAGDVYGIGPGRPARRSKFSAAFFVLMLAAVVAAVAVWPRPGPGLQVLATGSCSPARPHASGTSVETISTPFGMRTYRLHVPTGYTGNSIVPLVLNWHGATSTAVAQESYTGFSTKADASGFIVVYPQGVTTTTYNFNHFNAWQLGAPEPDDVAFAGQLLDTLQSQLCVDINRVFSTGFSNGAMMSVRLACSLSNRIAAIGGVAAAYYPPVANDLNASETCPDTTAVPLIEFHGTSDPIVPYNGGPGGIPGFMITFRLPQDDNTVAEDVLADWAAHDGCTSARQESQATTNVRLVQYTSCTNSAIAQLYAVDGGGHTWPDATVDIPVGTYGTTTHEVSATDLMWAFFQSHPLTPLISKPTPTPTIDPSLDSDGDGCPDVKELQTAIGSEFSGGRRDPNNPWDYFNPTHDGKNRVDDILVVIKHFGKNQGDAGYSTDYDRTAIGPNPWNLGPPNGQIRVDDILAIIKQFNHDCS